MMIGCSSARFGYAMRRRMMSGLSPSGRHTAIVALGSNLGGDKRVTYIELALRMLNSKFDGRVVNTSGLFESLPAHVDPNSMPKFLNAAVELQTNITDPIEVLRRLRQIETAAGGGKEKGASGHPRKIDLDLLFFDDKVYQGDNLTVPHPLIQARSFVLQPLLDLDPYRIHPVYNKSIKELWESLRRHYDHFPAAVPFRRVMVFGNRIWEHDVSSGPRIMGILNMTPDSFFDGGKFNGSVGIAVQRAAELVNQGAHIIDIGGESTRPGAMEVAEDAELRRVIPVIGELRKHMPEAVISIDTRRSIVAKTALEAGADMVNDVSGCRFDPNMLSLLRNSVGGTDGVACSYVHMHSRSSPDKMTKFTKYGNLTADVAHSIRQGLNELLAIGFPRWRLVSDIGLGFAKDPVQSFKMLKDLKNLDDLLPTGVPKLVGFSRKRMLGFAVHEGENVRREAQGLSTLEPVQVPASGFGVKAPEEDRRRAWAGAACACWSTIAGAAFLRVHDVQETAWVIDSTTRIIRS